MLNPPILKKQMAEPPPNPDEFLTGICGTCKNRVTCQRKDAKPSGDFQDLLSTECDRCMARVYLRREDKSLENQLQETKKEMGLLAEKSREQETTIKELREIKTRLEDAITQLTKQLEEKSKGGMVAELFSRMEKAMEQGIDCPLSEKDKKILEVLEMEEVPPIPEGRLPNEED